MSTELSPRRRLAATLTGLISGFTMVLGGTIVNVSIPDVMGAYGVGQNTAQFMSTAFIATMTASQLLAAWFVAQFGRRTSFSLIMVLFMVGGLICAVSPTIEVLIGGRIVQGFCAGVVQPLIMTTIISMYPPDQRGRAIGLYVGMLGLAVGFGPVVGGITVDALGWRWIFLVSLPFISLALMLGALFMPEDDRAAEKKPFDWWGYGLLCVALLSLMSAISGGQREGWWSDIILTYWLVGAAATVGFIMSQHYRAARLLDFSLFTDSRFTAAIALAVVFGIGNFGIAYAIPVFGQLVLNLTPTAAGLLLLPAGIISSIATVIVGRLVDRMSPFVLIITGIGMGFCGTYALSSGDANTPILTLLLFGIACRLGQSFMGPSITASAMRALPPEALAQGSGTISFFRQMGGAFGISCLVAAVEMRTSFHHHALGATQHGANRSTSEFLNDVQGLLFTTGIPEPAAHQMALKFLQSSVAAQSDALAWRDGFLLLAGIFVLAVLPAWLLGRAQRAKAY